jgi:hypothetical protein
MGIERSMRLPDLAQNGSVSVGDLMDAIEAALLPKVLAKVEAAVLADLRVLLVGARPTPPAS